MTGKPYRAVSRKDRIEQAIARDPLAAFTEIAEQVGCTVEQVIDAVDGMDRAHIDAPSRPAAKKQPTPPGTPVRTDHTGSHRAFNRHKKRGETPCGLCVLAEAGYQRARHIPRSMAGAGRRGAA